MSGISPINAVGLRVSDLAAMTSFYEEVIGLRAVSQDDGHVALCPGESGSPIMLLEEAPGAPERSRDSAGLFHAAIRLPDRPGLAQALRRVEAAGHPLTGASDHLVSEALYLDDPEGNGLELYRDRPREEWDHDEEGHVVMATRRLDLDDLRAEADESATRAPDGTDMGHVHLEVTDLDRAARLCADVFGMNLRATWRGAGFFAFGDYHHHVAVNTWKRRREPIAEGALGVSALYGHIASTEEADALAERANTHPGTSAAIEAGVLTVRDADNFVWEFCIAGGGS
ncbi:MAG: VOC family protein [Persicimonas sp.]